MKSKIEIRKSNVGGRGVFATASIRKGEIIEICPALPLTPAEYTKILETGLSHYVYTWIGPKQKKGIDPTKWSSAAIVMGYGMMYNHSFEPNAIWTANPEERTMTFTALRAIRKDEEIFHNYYWPEWLYEKLKIPIPAV